MKQNRRRTRMLEAGNFCTGMRPPTTVIILNRSQRTQKSTSNRVRAWSRARETSDRPCPRFWQIRSQGMRTLTIRWRSWSRRRASRARRTLTSWWSSWRRTSECATHSKKRDRLYVRRCRCIEVRNCQWPRMLKNSRMRMYRSRLRLRSGKIRSSRKSGASQCLRPRLPM